MFSLVAVSAELAEWLVAIESGGADAVHQARIRVRRLRSILSVDRRAFEKNEAKRLRRRLGVLGSQLGTARDLEVRADALAALIADAETGADADPLDQATVDAVTAFSADARAAHAAAVTALVGELHGRAHRQLLADVVAFAANPPLSARGAEHPRRTARKALAKAGVRVLEQDGDTLEERHAARKAARRLRYAAEAVTDTFGRDAVRVAAAAEALQNALGDHRDLVLLATHLRQKAEDASIAPEAEAGIARIADRCDERAVEHLAGLDDLADAVARAL
ncbi:CHAD domain-containing protein [Leifsonia sp. NPDC102414]|uniref:CHAD domain-containing protein n=1 Tax=Leifsonia sp. NPDC102414 TaxID=3364124 RepID=UPI003814E74C